MSPLILGIGLHQLGEVRFLPLGVTFGGGLSSEIEITLSCGSLLGRLDGELEGIEKLLSRSAGKPDEQVRPSKFRIEFYSSNLQERLKGTEAHEYPSSTNLDHSFDKFS